LGATLEPCIAFASLGLCHYNPAAPATTYFGLGDAVAALALTLAVQQFLKPVYVFRLDVRGLKLWHIYVLCFLGWMASLVAALLPSLPIDRDHLLAYPLIWELGGATCFLISYATLALGSTIPLKIRNGGYERFARVLAAFLSEKREEDYIEISGDVLGNFTSLLRKAAFADLHWRNMSAFFEFTFRAELKDGGYASSLLRIMSDEHFCRSLVEGAPWRLARIFETISDEQIKSISAGDFIQQITRQALISEKGLMSRETGYQGFSNVPYLSGSIFGSVFVLHTYRPLQLMRFEDVKIGDGFAERFHLASKMTVTATVNSKRYWEVHHLHDLKEVYVDIIRDIRRAKPAPVSTASFISVSFGINDFLDQVMVAIENDESSNLMYITSVKDHERFEHANLASITAELIFEVFEAFSNDFDGFDDRFWHMAFDLWRRLFSDYPKASKGMNPVQQRLALLLLDKVDDNLAGYYPAILRVLLCTVGSYSAATNENRKTPGVIFRRALYSKLRGFKSLAMAQPDKFADYLPAHVTYDISEDTFVHTSRNGEKQLTKMREIRPQMPSLDRQAVALH
jgi:hypothetical protein